MLRNILLSALLTAGIFTMMVYTACTKEDKCASISCNYGTCADGVCTCYSGYTGTLCDKKLCEANNTSRVRFENKSTANHVYSVVWDGSTLTTIAVGQTSEYFTVAAGQHTLHFMIANGGGAEACTVSSPVLVQCFDHSYYCTY